MVPCWRTSLPNTVAQCVVFCTVQEAGDVSISELMEMLPRRSEADLLRALRRLTGSRHLWSYVQPSRAAPEDPDADCTHWAVLQTPPATMWSK